MGRFLLGMLLGWLIGVNVKIHEKLPDPLISLEYWDRDGVTEAGVYTTLEAAKAERAKTIHYGATVYRPFWEDARGRRISLPYVIRGNG